MNYQKPFLREFEGFGSQKTNFLMGNMMAAYRKKNLRKNETKKSNENLLMINDL